MEDDGAPATGITLIDPRAPRFGQGVTASLLLVAIALEIALLVTSSRRSS